MAKTDQEVRELLARFIGINRPTMFGTVKDVDKSENTCTVEDDGVEWLGVRLRAITGENNGIVAYPKTGAYVLCVKVEDTEEWTVIKASEYESIEMTIESLVMNNGDNGGLVISQKVIDEFKTQINRINSIVSSLSNLATAMTATAQAPVLGAALGTAITTAISGIVTPLTIPQASTIENTKIKH